MRWRVLYGCGSKLNWRGYAGFGPCFHLPRFHFGTVVLSHRHINAPSDHGACRLFPPSSLPALRPPCHTASGTSRTSSQDGWRVLSWLVWYPGFRLCSRESWLTFEGAQTLKKIAVQWGFQPLNHNNQKCKKFPSNKHGNPKEN